MCQTRLSHIAYMSRICLGLASAESLNACEPRSIFLVSLKDSGPRIWSFKAIVWSPCDTLCPSITWPCILFWILAKQSSHVWVWRTSSTSKLMTREPSFASREGTKCPVCGSDLEALPNRNETLTSKMALKDEAVEGVIPVLTGSSWGSAWISVWQAGCPGSFSELQYFRRRIDLLDVLAWAARQSFSLIWSRMKQIGLVPRGAGNSDMSLPPSLSLSFYACVFGELVV